MAHQRLSGVSAPPHGFKPIGPHYYSSYSYAAAADPEMHVVVPRKTGSAFLQELEEDEGPRMTVSKSLEQYNKRFLIFHLSYPIIYTARAVNRNS